MPNPPPGPRAKIARAKKHLTDLADATVAFVEAGTQPYSIAVEREADKVLYRVKDVAEIPAVIPCILGDFIHNLRSALDILVCDLARHNGCKDVSDHCFPIGKNAHAFKSRFGGAIEQSLSKPARKAIKALNPYKGGNDDLWALSQLDNIDKHSLLLTAVAANMAIDLSRVTASKMRASVKIPGTTDWVNIPVSAMPPLKPPKPCVEDGDVIFGPIEALEGDDKIGLEVEIALNQPGIVECESLRPFTNKLLNIVDGVVTSFDPLFS